MSQEPSGYSGEFDLPTEYEIRIRGRLEAKWSDWFGGLTMHCTAEDVTVLRGTVVDQPALTAILNKLCELGLPLLSVSRLDRGHATQEREQHDA